MGGYCRDRDSSRLLRRAMGIGTDDVLTPQVVMAPNNHYHFVGRQTFIIILLAGNLNQIPNTITKNFLASFNINKCALLTFRAI